MLIHFGVIPYLVFDGDYLPSKAATEAERAKRREDSKRLGLELHRMGKISQANLELQKAIDVTPEMARQLVEELKQTGVQYVVAPYEADAQLAYLERKGIIQAILSEDSDLLVFGAKCLLTKLDHHGECIEINSEDFGRCQEISMAGWTGDDFRRMAILSGCDYLANINKMGLKTAHRYVRKHKTIERILRMLQFEKYHVPAGYLEAFQRAELTFLHQRVFCPIANDIVMMTKPPLDIAAEDLDFLGSHVEKEIALGIVRGDLHPMTKRPITIQHKVSRSPRTPWRKTLKQAVETPSVLKPKSSIEAYLKAYRTPLAELDPNSLTPSPSQQRLLHQANGTWASSPAPGRPGQPRSSTSLPLSDTTFASRRTGLSSAAGSVSAPHPLKKRRLCSGRLCSDTAKEDELATQKSTVESSRFFASSKLEASPSVDGIKRKAKPKKANFNIWSDDSVEEAMAQLPDVSQTPTSSKKEVIQASAYVQATLERPLDSGVAGKDTQTESQGSVTSQSTLHTEASTCTSATSVAGAVKSEPVAKTLDTYVQLELATLTKDYLYQPESEKCRVQRHNVIKNASQPEHKPTQQRQRSMTPLQRLGATALNRSYSYNSSLNQSSASQSYPVDSTNGGLPGLTDVMGPSAAKSPAKAAPIAASTVVKGSEDAMIPDSEAESEGSQPEYGQKKPEVDLGRFAFTGT